MGFYLNKVFFVIFKQTLVYEEFSFK